MNLVTYYGLVLTSLTGLSSILELTNTVRSDESNEIFTRPRRPGWSAYAADAVDVRPLRSLREPSICVRDSVFRYLGDRGSSGAEATGTASDGRRTPDQFALVRGFEYYFRPLSLHVMMLHFRSVDDGTLHLVEIYHYRNVVARHVFGALFSMMSYVARKLF